MTTVINFPSARISPVLCFLRSTLVSTLSSACGQLGNFVPPGVDDQTGSAAAGQRSIRRCRWRQKQRSSSECVLSRLALTSFVWHLARAGGIRPCEVTVAIIRRSRMGSTK